jgi:hypothetical protein
MIRAASVLLAIVLAGASIAYANDVNPCETPVPGTGTYTDIAFPGGTETVPVGVNSRGEIVGTYRDSTGSVKGFLFSQGTYASFSIDRSTTTNFNDINSAGAIAGYSFGSSGHHGFVLHNGQVTTVDVPGALATTPFALNDSGTVVGVYGFGEDDGHGFIYRDGRFITVDYPGATNTVLRKISNAGVVFGSAFVGTGSVNFLYVRGDFFPITACQPERETLIGISPQGDPFGSVATGPNMTAGFLLTQQQYTLVQPPGATQVIIRDANTRYIVGRYFDGTTLRGFLYSAHPKDTPHH